MFLRIFRTQSKFNSEKFLLIFSKTFQRLSGDFLEKIILSLKIAHILENFSISNFFYKVLNYETSILIELTYYNLICLE